MTTCWKQPTPTDINHMQEFDALDRAIFREILSLCQNKNTVINFIQSDKHYSVELNRGQCIFKVSKFAKEMKIDPKRVRKNIEKLSKWYSQMDSKAMPFGLVITMINYDDLVKMESQMDNDGIVKGESKDSQRRANKSVKSVKGGVDELENEAKELLLLVNNLYDKKYSSVKAWLGNYKKLRDDYTLEDFKTAIKNIKHHKWLSGQEDGQDKIDMVILTRTSQDWIGKLLSFGEEKKLDPKTSLIQAGYKFWEKGDK